MIELAGDAIGDLTPVDPNPAGGLFTTYDPTTGENVTGLLNAIHDPARSTGYLDEVFSALADMDETSAVTIAQNAQNLKLAAGYARDQVGLLGVPESQWSQADMLAYITAFRWLIIGNQLMFTPDTVLMAQHINLNRPDYGDPTSGIADFGVAVTDFIGPAVDAISPIANTPGALAGLLSSAITALNSVAKSASTGILTPLLFAGIIVFALSKSSGAIGDVKGIFRR